MNLIAKDTVWLTERKGIKAKVVFEKFRRRMNVLYMTKGENPRRNCISDVI